LLKISFKCKVLLPLGEKLINFSGLSVVFTRVGIGNNVKMTTDSQFDDNSPMQFDPDLLEGNNEQINESTGAKSMVKRDRFELLSAYLDGEVSAAERKQVEEWLATDPTVQGLHTRLLKLRQSLRALPVPQQPVEETANKVFERLHRRYRLAWVFGATAAAACVIGSVSSLLPFGESRIPRLAKQQFTEQTQQTPGSVVDSPLMVAIHKPVLPIPKAAKASPENPVNHLQFEEWDLDKEIY
jgi:hypothetical protein